MLKENKGSLTVEASLSLLIFIFAFLSILYLSRFAKAQIILQHAINQTAKEISQYSYISNKLGIQNDKTHGNRTIEETDKIIGEIVNFKDIINGEKKNIEDIGIDKDDIVVNDYYDAIKMYKKYDEAGNIIKDSYDNISDSTITLLGNIHNYLRNPKALLGGFLAIAKDEIADFAVSKYVAAPMSRFLVEKYLSTKNYTTDKYLKKLGVDNGLEGLNFDISTIFKDGSTINITLIYNMTLNLPLFSDKVLCFKLNASTIGWQSKLFYDANTSDMNSTGKKTINIWDYGGEKTTDEFIKLIANKHNFSIVRTPLSLDYYDNINNTFTYVHSMNTELKSYVKDGSLNMSQIKSKIKYYAKDALRDTKQTKKITMEDGSIYADSSIRKNQKIKVIMVVQASSCGSSSELDLMLEQIKRELNSDKLEIEFYYSDGLIEVKN